MISESVRNAYFWRMRLVSYPKMKSVKHVKLLVKIGNNLKQHERIDFIEEIILIAWIIVKNFMVI